MLWPVARRHRLPPDQPPRLARTWPPASVARTRRTVRRREIVEGGRHALQGTARRVSPATTAATAVARPRRKARSTVVSRSEFFLVAGIFSEHAPTIRSTTRADGSGRRLSSVLLVVGRGRRCGVWRVTAASSRDCPARSSGSRPFGPP
jgi:hypothetical protein